MGQFQNRINGRREEKYIILWFRCFSFEKSITYNLLDKECPISVHSREIIYYIISLLITVSSAAWFQKSVIQTVRTEFMIIK